jgi:excisionase family DNA binding protein
MMDLEPRDRPATLRGMICCEEGAADVAEFPEVMNIRRAAEYLGVNPETLYKYAKEGSIPAFKLGNRWKFKKSVLDAWMERECRIGEARGKKGKPPVYTLRKKRPSTSSSGRKFTTAAG